jgi:hypothetical protein
VADVIDTAYHIGLELAAAAVADVADRAERSIRELGFELGGPVRLDSDRPALQPDT